jgi:hypothetical protein
MTDSQTLSPLRKSRDERYGLRLQSPNGSCAARIPGEGGAGNGERQVLEAVTQQLEGFNCR